MTAPRIVLAVEEEILAAVAVSARRQHSDWPPIQASEIRAAIEAVNRARGFDDE